MRSDDRSGAAARVFERHGGSKAIGLGLGTIVPAVKTRVLAITSVSWGDLAFCGWPSGRRRAPENDDSLGRSPSARVGVEARVKP